MKDQDSQNQKLARRRRRGGLLGVVTRLLSGGLGVAATAVTAIAVIVATVAIVQVATSNTAAANVPSGYRNMTYGSGGSGYAVWDNCYTTSCYDYYYASVTAGAASSGYCYLTGYDWKVYEGVHFDSRQVRSCKSWAFHESYGVFETHPGRTLIGMQKLGMCYGQQYNETAYGCATQSDSEAPISSISMWYTCFGGWTRNADNSTYFNTGGDPTKCES